MKILLAASEAVPFCKTGGLADVVGALSQKLGAAGHDVCVFLPKYLDVDAAALQGGMATPISVPLGSERIEASLRYLQWRSVSVYFIDYPPFYDRNGLYGKAGKDHPDNDRRFILYCRGVLEGAKAVGFKPDVVHCHDWQAGLIPAYLKRVYGGDPFYAATGSVMTVHNMAYQGNFPHETLPVAGLPEDAFTPDGLEYYGKLSFLKAGLAFADRLTTVSPTYAKEIASSSERGFGLEGLLKARESDLRGILNGLDLEAWNPERDAALPARFSAKDPAGKKACRAALLKECGLKDDGKPVVGIVSRLDHQKGLDLAIKALEPRLDRLRLVLVGTGDPALQDAFAALSKRRPDAVHARLGFDDAFARRAYAGSDLFLMPSRFEPCGLGQMIAMRYGALPVASRTGGLADTVAEPGNGFLCAPNDAGDLGRALDRALKLYGSAKWPALVSAALATSFPWDRSTARYVETYKEAAAAARASR